MTTYRYRLRACNGGGCSPFGPEVSATTFESLAIGTMGLPVAILGAAFETSLEAAGGNGQHAFELAAGALPLGLVLGPGGLLTGTPLEVGTFRFSLRVRSGDGQTVVQELSIMVISDGPALEVRTRLLPPGVVGLPYGPVIEANGGTGAPVTWVLTSGTLPPGVRLEPEGSFSGQPTVPGTFTFSVLAYGGGVANVTFTASIVALNGSRFDITRLDVTPVPGGVEPHVLAAIARWESVIVGDLSEDSVPRDLFGPGDCSGSGADLNGAAIEDLLILVHIDSIDGPRRHAGPGRPLWATRRQHPRHRRAHPGQGRPGSLRRHADAHRHRVS